MKNFLYALILASFVLCIRVPTRCVVCKKATRWEEWWIKQASEVHYECLPKLHHDPLCPIRRYNDVRLSILPVPPKTISNSDV